jgi:hypothetical protein
MYFRESRTAAFLLALTFCGSASAAVYTFSGAAVAYPTQGPGTPYPGTIVVSGIPANEAVVDVNVTITGYSHTFPDDTGSLVTNSSNTGVVLHNGHGDGTDVVDLVWVFDDSAAGPLPAQAVLTSGTFQPGNLFPADSFNAPAPAAPYAANLAALNAGNPNGTWSLYLMDFVQGDGGDIDGWSIQITTTVVPEPASLFMLMVPGMVALGRRRRA